MFGDITVKAQADFIADPRRLVAEIEALAMLLPATQDTRTALKSARSLVLQATQIEHVQMNVDAEIMDKNSDYMDFVNDKLRTALGDRLVRVIGTIVTTTREE